MKTSQFEYNLSTDFIAQTPIEPRHNSRLMVVHRDSDIVQHARFFQIGDYLQSGDLLVINRTRVLPARIFANKPSGGRVELLLLRKKNETTWETLVGGKGIKKETQLSLEKGLSAKVIEVLDGSQRLVQFSRPIENDLQEIGEMPLPPYIHTKLTDPERYQTVYADQSGSAAAPTAGLHFTKELMQRIEKKGIQFTEVTLHVGLDTFAPVNEEDPREHKIHREWCEVDSKTAAMINSAHNEGRRIIAVGTTCVRVLETAARFSKGSEIVGTFSGNTDLFILPGYEFRTVDALITNFHLPRSTLLMLVSAFAGLNKVLGWYQAAMANNYRFYSFGDAMLIL